MIQDLGTMLWKEAREFLLQRGSATKGALLGLGIPIGVFGIFLPLQSGESWVDGNAGMLMVGWMPMFIVLSVVADSFAGERERHTLETLLATRLADQTILFGKVAVAVLYSWGLVVVTLALGLVAVNIARTGGQLLMYPLDRLAAFLVLSFLVSVFAASSGVLVSLRASSVRQAAQTLSFGFLIIIFGGIFGIRLLPAEWQAGLASLVAQGSLTQTLALAGAILLVVDIALLAAAHVRFRRAGLILD